MFKRTLLTALAASLTLAFAASAQAAYLSLGTTNTSDTTTTLSGNTTGSELLVKNTNDSSASALGVYGWLSATAPSVSAAAIRGFNSSTNGKGFGVFGSQEGTGTGVYGYTPSGRGVWGNSGTGIGAYGTTASTAAGASGVFGSAVSSSAVASSAGVRGVNGGAGAGVYGTNVHDIASGYGVAGTGRYGVVGTGLFSGASSGVYGTATNGFAGVEGHSGSGVGVAGFSDSWQGVYGHSNSQAGVVGDSGSFDGVWGQAHSDLAAGVSGHTDSNYPIAMGVYGYSPAGRGVNGESPDGDGVRGYSANATGVFGRADALLGNGVEGFVGSANGARAIYGDDPYANGWAGYFQGNVYVSGVIQTGASTFKIDDPLDPAHKYLNHASVASSQQLDVYSGNVSTNAKGFATVTMPRWFQALNRSFRYQLTVVGKTHWDAKAAVWNEIKSNRFTIRTDQPDVKVSWQVTGVRHDRFAKAHPVRVVPPKAKKDQGKYVNPELYGKPKSEGIGYQKPPGAPRATQKK
jgi:hypothetical protein